MQPAKFLGMLLGVSPDPPQGGRSGKDSVHHNIWCILLSYNALRAQKCWYQRDIQKCLYPQLRKNVEAYVDDVVIKTQKSVVPMK
jgi:hypothetical protein